MNFLIVDVETTTKNKGSPWTTGNRLITCQLKDQWGVEVYPIEYNEEPFGENLDLVREAINNATVLIGVNIKFDLQWLLKYLPDLDLSKKRIWDCSIAHFIETCQQHVMPSLDAMCEYHGLPLKPDIIRTEYWDKGLDTDQVPWNILKEYGIHDVEMPWEIYRHQISNLSTKQQTLVWLQGWDLLCLLECERNGLLLDKDKTRELLITTRSQMEELYKELRITWPQSFINWNSNDHLSAILFGGRIKEKAKIEYIRELKAGPVVKEKWGNIEHEFAGICKPLKKWETLPTKEWSDKQLEEINKQREEEGKEKFWRVYSVSEPVLLGLSKKPISKQASHLIEIILKLAKLDKLCNTYYEGMLKLLDKHGATDNVIHGQFNQTVAITGRLSSSNPNLQNLEDTIKQLMISEWPS